jgi:uncharacterized membrane protein
MNKDRLMKAVSMTFFTLITQQGALAAKAAPEESQEKCYGIVKAGISDCSTATSSCAGSATQDNQKDAFFIIT